LPAICSGAAYAARAHRHAGARQADVVVVERLREAEVRDPRHVVVGDDDVRGLEIAVDDPGGVRERQAVAHGARDADDARGRHRPVVDQLGERAAVDEVHDDVGQPALGRAVVDDSDDVRVREPARALGLAREPLAHRRRRAGVAEQHLHGVALVRERRVVRLVHAPHAALADEPIDHVATDRLAEQRICVEHDDLAAVVRAARVVLAVHRAARRAAPHGFEGAAARHHVRA
jgi:hypothetical protein